MNDRITVYILLIAGISIMAISVVQIFLVFTNQSKPFTVFTLPTETKQNEAPSLTNFLKNPNDLTDLKLPTPQIIPTATMNQLLNMTVYYFLMSFLMGFGHKLASLGINLLHNVKKEEENR